MSDTPKQSANTPEFAIQRIYVKDISYEAPNVPLIFKDEWQPHLQLDLNSSSKALENDMYEIELFVTATVKSNDKHAFVVEVKHAGIFTLKNFPQEQLDPMLGAACPAILFPYVRETISDIVVRGGFPQLCLAPINFEAIYAKQLEEQAKAQQGKAANEQENAPIPEMDSDSTTVH